MGVPAEYPLHRISLLAAKNIILCMQKKIMYIHVQIYPFSFCKDCGKDFVCHCQRLQERNDLVKTFFNPEKIFIAVGKR